jgi:radical SAM superfamily enzyme YgiQ (UPF0313 family)
MKIGLISPFGNKANTYYSNNPELQRFFATNKNVPVFFHPNLALLTLASLTPATVELKLIDERVDTLQIEEDFDLVGISMITSQSKRGYEIADKFRKRGVYTVLGGIHPTVLPDEARSHCDTVVLGEAENSWPRLLGDFSRGKPLAVYKDSGVDITKSPVPRYDLVDASKFHILPIQTTRGCPRDCSFCTVKTVFGPDYRMKSTAQIVREVEAVLRIADNKRCIFNDDNMFVNKGRTYEILEAIKPLRVRYFAQTDVSVAEDDKLLRMLRESGCVTLFIGFESLVPENLAGIQKSGWKLKQSQTYSEKCRRIQSHGIQVLGSFVVGLDYDTRDGLLRLNDFVLENNVWAQFLFATPFPGTRMRDDLIEQGRIDPCLTNWEFYTCFDAIVKPLNMTLKQLNETVLEIYESVYSESAHRKRMRHMVENIKTASSK